MNDAKVIADRLDDSAVASETPSTRASVGAGGRRVAAADPGTKPGSVGSAISPLTRGVENPV